MQMKKEEIEQMLKKVANDNSTLDRRIQDAIRKENDVKNEMDREVKRFEDRLNRAAEERRELEAEKVQNTTKSHDLERQLEEAKKAA
jgi:hypothetical protein